MRRRTLLILAVIGLAGVLTLFWLQSHSVDLVHAVVLSAMLQKIPEDYPPGQVEAVFDRTRREALDRGQQQRYLQALVLVSQRLEKRQALYRWEVDDALELLADYQSLD